MTEKIKTKISSIFTPASPTSSPASPNRPGASRANGHLAKLSPAQVPPPRRATEPDVNHDYPIYSPSSSSTNPDLDFPARPLPAKAPLLTKSTMAVTPLPSNVKVRHNSCPLSTPPSSSSSSPPSYFPAPPGAKFPLATPYLTPFRPMSKSQPKATSTSSSAPSSKTDKRSTFPQRMFIPAGERARNERRKLDELRERIDVTKESKACRDALAKESIDIRDFQRERDELMLKKRGEVELKRRLQSIQGDASGVGVSDRGVMMAGAGEGAYAGGSGAAENSKVADDSASAVFVGSRGLLPTGGSKKLKKASR